MRIIYCLIPTLLAILLVISGYVLGRYRTQSPISNSIPQIVTYNQNLFLGELHDGDDEKRAAALAYLDPDECLRDMDQYTWRIPESPTPFLGHAPQPGRWGKAFVNAMQFRHATELEIPKPKDVFRIFITGGSTAFGSGAPGNDETISGFLQKLLNQNRPPEAGRRFEVINAAAPGWASTHERILIENRLSDMEPDLVVAFSGNNDVHWGSRKANVMWFRSYADQHFWSIVQAAYKQSECRPLIDVVSPEEDAVPPDVVGSRLVKNILLGADCLQAAETPFVYILQPNLKVTRKPLTPREHKHLEGHNRKTDYFRSCYEVVRRRLAALKRPNLYYVDFSDRFDELTKNDEIFLDSYHFGDRGNLIIAEEIFEVITPLIDGSAHDLSAGKPR